MIVHEKTKSSSSVQQLKATDVLVIEDEESMCEACRQTLEAEGCTTAIARDGESGLELIEKLEPAVVLLDLKMPGMGGSEVLNEIPKIDPSIITIIMTGYGTIDIAVESMKAGAFDFLTKPFEPEHLVKTVRRGMETSRYRKEPKSEGTALAEVPVTEEPVAEKLPLNKQNILLRGLEALGEYYALGLGERNFFHELRYMEAEAEYHAKSLGEIEKKEKSIRKIIQDLRNVDTIIAKHEHKKGALMQILLDIQKEMNWLPRHILKWVSSRLNVALADIVTITNFYEAFSLEPRGVHMVRGCAGTACHVRGAPVLLAKVSSILGIQPGETDPRHLFTLETVHCMGCCALAPVIKIDNEYYSNPSLPELNKILITFEEQEQV
ncbi:MAG: NAD(P)H-dependent oxidoreductase subunit E [Desulfobacterales bacterium]|nr:MAG: NAD(P)H-dependent oxidoreductase subunit E [Desulfobacterales bacterium]